MPDTFSILSTDLVRVLKNALLFVRKDNGRPSLACVQLDYRPDRPAGHGVGILAVATDSYRLSVETLPQPEGEPYVGGPFRFGLEAADIRTIISVLGKTYRTVRVTLPDSDGMVTVEHNGDTLWFAANSERFVEWWGFFDQKADTPAGGFAHIGFNSKHLTDFDKVRPGIGGTIVRFDLGQTAFRPCVVTFIVSGGSGGPVGPTIILMPVRLPEDRA